MGSYGRDGECAGFGSASDVGGVGGCSGCGCACACGWGVAESGAVAGAAVPERWWSGAGAGAAGGSCRCPTPRGTAGGRARSRAVVVRRRGRDGRYGAGAGVGRNSACRRHWWDGARACLGPGRICVGIGETPAGSGLGETCSPVGARTTWCPRTPRRTALCGCPSARKGGTGLLRRRRGAGPCR